jgi:hypothetical protein
VQSSSADFYQSPIKVYQTYQAQNPNYYSITLTDFNNLVMQTPTYSYTVNDVTYSYTFIAYGSGSTVSVASQDSATFTLVFNASATPADMIVLSNVCTTDNGVKVTTTGNFDCTTSLGKYYTLPFSKCHYWLVMIFKISSCRAHYSSDLYLRRGA